MVTLKELQETKNYYESIISKSKEMLKRSCPKGNLRVDASKRTKQYYLITDSKDTRGKYIRKRDLNIAVSIAQRDYNQRVFDCAAKWHKWLENVIKTYPSTNLVDVYNTSSARLPLFEPYEVPDEAFVKAWESVEYQGHDFYEDSTEIYTEKGERVRSKSEKIIADKLNLRSIPYRYEYPLALKNGKIIYPDFTILNPHTRKEFYLEHLGLMDNIDYCNTAIFKINSYARNGIVLGDNLFITMESHEMPLDTLQLDKILEVIMRK